MKNNEHIAGKIQEFRNEMWDVFQTIKNNKWRILWALVWLSMLWAAANHHDENKQAEWQKEKTHEQNIKYEREHQMREEWEWRQIDREKRLEQGIVIE